MILAISRLYDDCGAAQQAVRDLEAAGLPSDDISIVAKNGDVGLGSQPSGGRESGDRSERAETGAGIGAVVGTTAGVATAGLLASLGAFAIPGIGIVTAAGWVVTAAAGAFAGGVAGGIVGALTRAGVNKDDADVYAEGLRRGGTLVIVRLPDSEIARYEAILDRSAVNTKERRDTYRKAGWISFDENAVPYRAAEHNRPGRGKSTVVG